MRTALADRPQPCPRTGTADLAKPLGFRPQPASAPSSPLLGHAPLSHRAAGARDDRESHRVWRARYQSCIRKGPLWRARHQRRSWTQFRHAACDHRGSARAPNDRMEIHDIRRGHSGDGPCPCRYGRPATLVLAVDRLGHAIGHRNEPNPRLFVAGPLARGTFGELMGVSDLSAYAEKIAQRIAASWKTVKPIARYASERAC